MSELNGGRYDADVFGRVSDAAGDNALDRDEASDAGRIANIGIVEPGVGKVTFEITVSRWVSKERRYHILSLHFVLVAAVRVQRFVHEAPSPSFSM